VCAPAARQRVTGYNRAARDGSDHRFVGAHRLAGWNRAADGTIDPRGGAARAGGAR